MLNFIGKTINYIKDGKITTEQLEHWLARKPTDARQLERLIGNNRLEAEHERVVADTSGRISTAKIAESLKRLDELIAPMDC